MIKKLFLAVVVVFFTSSLFSQNFAKGDNALNLGIGIGSGFSDYYDFSLIPAFNASFEAGIVDIPNAGVIGVGGFAGFGFHPYYGNLYANTIVAGRGVFHFQFFDTGDFDLYAGVNTGLEFGRGYDYFVTDEFIGARWMKSEKFGFFAELGYGISFLKGGITMKF